MTSRRALIVGAVILVSVLVSGPVSATGEASAFDLPVPEGWRTETLPFPLEFAPELPYTGVEELRFAPGMFEEGSADFWSYAFVWWIDEDEPTDLESLATHLATYFRGLAHSVAKTREFEVGEATFKAALEPVDGGDFAGWAETFDAFTTRSSLRLNVRGEVLSCSVERRQAVVFLLSPQELGSPVWETLTSIGDGFSCHPHASADEADDSDGV